MAVEGHRQTSCTAGAVGPGSVGRRVYLGSGEAAHEIGAQIQRVLVDQVVVVGLGARLGQRRRLEQGVESAAAGLAPQAVERGDGDGELMTGSASVPV